MVKKAKKARTVAKPAKKTVRPKRSVSKISVSPVGSRQEEIKSPKRKVWKFSFNILTWKLAPLATLGPLGYFPKGSGTIGSLVALPLVYLLSYLSVSLFWFITLILFILGLVAVEQFTRDKSEKDPHCVIIDEVVGQMIPFMVILPEFMHWPVLFLGFALFRFFDIFKFGIVAFWDRRKNPLGVMMDDVTAGLCSGFIMAMIQVIVVEVFGI